MPPADPTPDDRLAALERAVLDLRREVDALRAERAVAPSAAPPPAVVPAPAARDVFDVFCLGARPTPRPGGTLAAAYARAQAAGLGIPLPADGAAPDLEAVVGRYGTVAVAALFVLLAAGALLTWAVANYDLTPAARVALGAVAAAALATAGGWLRYRAGRAAPAGDAGDPQADERAGSRRFGDVLLALALAVTHVVAWAAGPYLRLVPPAAALAVAAAASAALAALAWRARQQVLFIVGVGGALVAPFVTGSAEGAPTALRVYGWLVLSSALLAIPADERRRWRGAFRLLALGGATYTAAHFGGPLAMAAVGNPAGLVLPGWMLARHAPVLFALATAVVPLALAGRRPVPEAETADAQPPAGRTAMAQLALAYVSAGAVALLALAVDGAGTSLWILGLALAGTLMVYAALWPLTPGALALAGPAVPRGAGRVVARLTAAAVAVVHPLVFLAAALAGLDRATGAPGAGTAALWGALATAAAVVTWRRAEVGGAAGRPRPSLPSAHATAAGLSAALVPVFLFSIHEVVRVTTLAVVAGLAAQAMRPLRHPLALLAPAVTAGAAAAWAWTLLDGRTSYFYTPFVTNESVAAGATVAAWVAIAVRVWRDGAGVFPLGERRAVVGAAILVALGWGHEELAHAVAPDVSTVLLIAYFALAGIGSIALGRARRAPAARQIGLLLALYAAAKALLQASQLDAVGLRVLSYLVVGGFFLGIAYWYRAAGSTRTIDRQPDATSAV